MNFISVEELARKLGRCGYVLLSVAELVGLLAGEIKLADVERRRAA